MVNTVGLSIDPQDGHIKKWNGLKIPADTREEAEQFCQDNGYGYLKVTGIWVEDIEITDEEYDNIMFGNLKKNLLIE